MHRPWPRPIIAAVAVAIPIIGIGGDLFDRSLAGRFFFSLRHDPNIVLWLSWGLAVPLLFALEARFPLRRPNLRTLAVHLLALLTICGAQVALLLLINFAEVRHQLGRAVPLLIAQTISLVITYYAILFAGGYALRAWATLRDRERREAVLATELVQAEVELLKVELDANSLLTELQTIATEIDRDPRRAEERIETLSEFLHRVLGEIAGRRNEPRVEVSTVTTERTRRTWLAFLLAPLAFSLAISAVPIARDVALSNVTAGRLGRTLLHVACLTLFIPLFVFAARIRRRIVAPVLLLLLAFAAAAGTQVAFVGVDAWFRDYDFAAQLRHFLPSRTFSSDRLFFLGVAGAALASQYAERARERELASERMKARLADAQLRALQMQLHPHFLFNTLNSVAGLLEDDARAARLMLERLERFLRTSLTLGDAQEVALREELGFVMTYLEIQRARFGERLRIETEVDDALLDALVPTLVLQPLVENAVKHGIAPKKGHGAICIRATAREGMLALTIEDDGTGLAGDVLHPGLGMTNTRARLEQLYGTRQRLTWKNVGKGFAVELLLPLHRA